MVILILLNFPRTSLHLPLAPAPITASDFILLFPHRLLDTLNFHNEISQREGEKCSFSASYLALFSNATDCVEIRDVLILIWTIYIDFLFMRDKLGCHD